jgi:hypothetical protein
LFQQAIRQSVAVLNLLPPAQKAGAIHAYVKALQLSFLVIGLPSSILTSVCGLIIENVDIRKEFAKQEKGGEESKMEEAADEKA